MGSQCRQNRHKVKGFRFFLHVYIYIYIYKYILYIYIYIYIYLCIFIYIIYIHIYNIYISKNKNIIMKIHCFETIYFKLGSHDHVMIAWWHYYTKVSFCFILVYDWFFTTLKATLDRNLSVDHSAMEAAMESFQINLYLKLPWNVFKCLFIIYCEFVSVLVSAFITFCIYLILFDMFLWFQLGCCFVFFFVKVQQIKQTFYLLRH